MSITQPTFDNLSRALTDLKFPTLSFSQADQLVEHTGVAKLQSLIAGARVNEKQDRDDLEERVIAVRAHYTLLELGFRESSLPTTIAVIREHGIAKVRLTVGDAMKGDANAKTILAGWLKRPTQTSPGELGPTASASVNSAPASSPQQPQQGQGASSSRAPIHPTPLPPPVRTMPVERASPPSSERAQPAQPAARNIQPAAAAQGTAVRTQNPQREAGNVHQLHTSPVERSQEHYTGYDDRSDAGTESAPRDVAPRGQKQYDQVGVFGRDRTGATALQFDCSPTPADKGGYLTINLSIARAKGSRTQDGVDWGRKICIMLSPGECVLCLNVLMGVNKDFRGAGHGRNNKKWFQMAESEGDYAGSVFVSLADGEDQRGCSIPPGDLFRAICIFQRAVLDQSRATEANIEPISMRDILRRVGAMYEAARESERARKEKKSARG